MRTTTFTVFDYLPDSLREIPKRRAAELTGAAILAGVAASSLALLSWSVEDPSLNHATSAPIHNWLGKTGAIGADIAMQFIGVACVAALPRAVLLGLAAAHRKAAGPATVAARSCAAGNDLRRRLRLAAARARELAAADGPRRRRRRRRALAPLRLLLGIDGRNDNRGRWPLRRWRFSRSPRPPATVWRPRDATKSEAPTAAKRRAAQRA